MTGPKNINHTASPTTASAATDRIGPRRRWARLVALVVAAVMVGAVLAGVAAVTGPVRPAAAAGVAYNVGDLFAGRPNGTISQYNQSGAPLNTLTTGAPYQAAGMCFDSANNLYATNFSAGDMSKFDTAGNLVTHPWVSGFNTHPESCVFDAAGNIYVGSVDPGDVRKFDAGGHLLATYNPGVQSRGVDWLELDQDQCTLYYTSEGSSVGRFNVCTNTQLTNFADNLPAPCYALRQRMNGEVSVACASAVERLDSNGKLIATYPAINLGETANPPDLFAFNLDPDGSSFWTAGLTTGNIYKVDFASGNVITHFASGGEVDGLALFGAAGPVGGALSPSETTPPNQTELHCQCDHARPVNTANGNFWHTFDDLSVPGRGPALGLSRTYSALGATTTGPFGYGWTSSYTMSLSTDATSGAVTVHQENGSTVTFNPNGTAYRAPPRVLGSLTKNPDATFTFTRRQRQRFTFSAAGQLLSITDLNGYATTLGYNASSQLSTVTDPAGRVLIFAYGTNNLVASVTDPAGRRVAYSYDTNNNLVSVNDVAANTTSFGYDTAHRMLTMTDPKGGVITNVYDSSGRVVKQTDSMGRATMFSYATGSTTITDPAGNATVERYVYGELVSATRGAGSAQAATWRYAYDQYNLGLTSITDPNGHLRSRSFDANGNLTSSSDGARDITTATYDSLNDPTTITDPSGLRTTVAYDPRANPLSASRTIAAGQVATVTFGYGDAAHPGDVTSIVDPLNRVTTMAYDPYGNRTKMSDPAGDTTTTSYDIIGRPTASVSPKGNVAGASPAAFTTTWTYNNYSDPTSATDPLNHTTTWAYDPNRNLIKLIDANGHATANAFDADNEPTTVTRADGTTHTNTYDPAGNLAGQTDGLANTTTYTYDAQNRPVTAADPLGHQTVTSYDPAGNVTAITDPAGQTTSYTRDAADRLTQITYSDNKTPTVTFAYDPNGRRTRMTGGSGTSTYTYDTLGRLTRTVDGTGHQIGYGYDLADQLTAITYPSLVAGVTAPAGTITRAYDPAGRLAAVTDWAAHTTTFGYDPNSNLIAQNYPNGTAAARTYDNADRLTQITDTGPGATPLLNLPYTHDPIGQLTTANATGTPTGAAQTYTYDTVNRLTGASNTTAATTTAANTYTYDAADNLTGMAGATLSAVLTHDKANQLTALTNTATAQTTTYSNDAKGNRTRAADAAGTTTTYTYDQANRLTGYAGPALNAANGQTGANVTLTYTYNGDGLRSDLIWDQTQGLPLIIGDATQTAYITGPGGLPLESLTPAGTTTYYHQDQLGSTRLLTTQAGTTQAAYNYDPYGNPTATTSTNNTNPFGYAGQYTDLQTGLIYMRARYYDPATGQFLSRDPLVAITGSAYGYVDDNPLNGTDPSGLYPGEGWVHKAEYAVTAVNRAVVDAVAVIPYAMYYGSEKLAQGINAVGCSPDLGPVEPAACVASHIGAAPLAGPEALGLVADAGIDAFKNAAFGNESICDEGKRGYINPFHSFLPGILKGPQIYLPGIHADGSVDFQW